MSNIVIQSAFSGIFPVIYPMRWFTEQIESIRQIFINGFTTVLFELGGQTISLWLLLQVVVNVLILLVVIRVVQEWLKRWLLKRFRLDRGRSEAITSVLGYLFLLLGFLIVLQNVGLNLSSLTVFAGAIGIGFGFALKNLASNFISGLTLLFEQPIKVGDFIEIGDLLGTVEKISFRSTTVRTFTDVYVIIPNDSLINSHVVNWSYQQSRCGLTLPVGVAYGSDTVLVTEALLAAARKENRVLSYPPPRVLFSDFGDSALQFTLIVWINQPQEQMLISSSLRFLIESEFRCRQIQIPFPQRDLHIRTPVSLQRLLSQNGAKQEYPSPSPASVLPTEPLPLPEKPHKTHPPQQPWTLRDLLRKVSYFENCSNLQLRELIEEGYRQVVPTQQIICREGDPGDAFYIILSGSIEVYSEMADQRLATRTMGDFFGEMSLLMGIPRTASVRALEDTVLFVVDKNNLKHLLTKHQELGDRISHELSTREESLRNLGLLDRETLAGTTPMVWIRNRISTLFGI